MVRRRLRYLQADGDGLAVKAVSPRMDITVVSPGQAPFETPADGTPQHPFVVKCHTVALDPSGASKCSCCNPSTTHSCLSRSCLCRVQVTTAQWTRSAHHAAVPRSVRCQGRRGCAEHAAKGPNRATRRQDRVVPLGDQGANSNTHTHTDISSRVGFG